jgi:hypothetical protein
MVIAVRKRGSRGVGVMRAATREDHDTQAAMRLSGYPFFAESNHALSIRKNAGVLSAITTPLKLRIIPSRDRARMDHDQTPDRRALPSATSWMAGGC